MICMFRVRGYRYCDTHYAEEHEDQSPPRKIREASMDSRDDRANEGNNPSELLKQVEC